ncbi:MAG: transcription-repair coupling factor [candidate division FCPU426 bacterium]
MPLRALLIKLHQDPQYTELCRLLSQTPHPKAWALGWWGSAYPFLWSGVREQVRRPLMLVVPTQDEARRLYDQFRIFLEHPDPEQEELFLFPGRELLPYEHALPDLEAEGERLEVLLRLARGQVSVVVAAAEQVREVLPSPSWLLGRCLTLAQGQFLDRDRLLADLIERGYVRESMVEARGQVAVRGGIVDIFPPADLSPWRVEFSGSEIVSLRRFTLQPDDPAPAGMAREAEITPARLFAPSAAEIRQGLARLTRQHGTAAVAPLAASLEADSQPPGAENYLPDFLPTACLLDYLPPETVVVMDSPGLCQKQAEQDEARNQRLYAERRSQAPLLPSPERLYLPFGDLGRRITAGACVLTGRLKQQVWPETEHWPQLTGVVKGTDPMRGSVELLVREALALKRQGLELHLVAHNAAEERRFRQILAEQASTLSQPDLLGHFTFHLGYLPQGFQYPACGIVVFSDQEIFNRHLGRPKPRRLKGAAYPSQPLSDVLELKIGDLAVHRDHGLARYGGVTRLAIDGGEQEFVLLLYANDEKLYVPTDQLRLVEKYLGSDGAPRLNHLGTGAWERTKQRVRESVAELARQLLEIYAARQVHEAHAFGPDTAWQKEFEEAFPYEETPDQARAILEVKRDLEKPKPMDRLVCGDVGFGKTEVAMRAAFKVTQEGMQVAVLVPTTILADQHFATFKERMAAYPVRIELLSRFRTPAEQKKVLRDLAQGAVDIVIGTHKLLSQDVAFAKLGLVILDEEQHFGVKQKEKLKKLRSVVDVLALTATPIPRTLYLSVSGIRDISVIETPPLNRLPIRTYVLEYSEAVIREAVLRELGRGGQVFFVHNRVQTIGPMAERLKRLVPEARIAVAHGQMTRDQLEPVMERFISRAEDMLVSTTIVEAGLDMPNVNTILINRADALGIAQLYQLRGRVGRADRQAYAYLFYPVGGAVTGDAEKRMLTLQEFTELGSGLKVALRDLEIRGAGDILGPEQSGPVTAVGFETYCGLLEEAVRELKGQRQEAPAEVKISIAQDAYLPGDYVPDTMARLNLYKRLAGVRTPAELAALWKEIESRFGPLPGPAQTLLSVAEVRVAALALRLREVNLDSRRSLLRWPKYYQPPKAVVDRLMAGKIPGLRFLPGEQPGFEFNLKGQDPLAEIKKFLSELNSV